MWVCYAIAVIPLVVGAILWLSSRRISFREWFVGSLIGFAVSGGFHYYTILSLTTDLEIWSGKVSYATYHPSWRGAAGHEDDDGWRRQCWSVTVSLGKEDQAFYVTEQEFTLIREKFNAKQLKTIRPDKEGFKEGDPHDYVAENHTGVIIPAHTIRIFDNRLKVTPSIFSFGDIPEGLDLFDYPIGLAEEDLKLLILVPVISKLFDEPRIMEDCPGFEWRQSQRLLGRAAQDFSIYQWDCLNAELGPQKRVNLIAIGFDGDSTLAQWQEAKWTGGKKNDLVLCYGPAGPTGKPAWTYCFGWTENELVKRNLESLLLKNIPGDHLLPQIKAEVEANYMRKHWSDFNYLTMTPPPGAVPLLILITIFVQGGYWTWAYFNADRRAAASVAEERDEVYELKGLSNKQKDRNIKKYLAHLKDPRDIDALTQELLEGEHYTAIAAATMLQRHRDRRAITSLVLGLTSKDQGVRMHSGEWLNEHVLSPSDCAEAKAAIPQLINRLTHTEERTRREARRVLNLIDPGWTRTSEALAQVEELLVSARGGTSWAALDALGARGDVVVEPLLKLFEEEDTEVRVNVLYVLGQTGDVRAVKPLLKSLSDQDLNLQIAAARGLGKFGPNLKNCPDAAETYEVLKEACQDDDIRIRLNIMAALGWLGDERALNLFLPLLEDDNSWIKDQAIWCLGALGSPGAIDGLVAKLHLSQEPSEQMLIIKALSDIGDRGIVRPLIDIYHNKVEPQNLTMKITIINAIWKFGGDEVVEFLKKVADDFRDEVDDVAGHRLKQLEAGFVPPGWI